MHEYPGRLQQLVKAHDVPGNEHWSKIGVTSAEALYAWGRQSEEVRRQSAIESGVCRASPLLYQ